MWTTKKEFDKAIADYSEAIRLDPKNVGVHHQRGNAWNQKKEYDKAIADFSETVRIDPKYIHGYWARAWTHNKAKQYDKATDYSEAVRLDPNHAGVLNGFARLLATCPDEKVRDGKRAVSLAKQAVTLGKNAAYLMHTLAAACAEAGDFDEAVRLQEQAMKDNRLAQDSGVRFRLQVYRQKQSYREGMEQAVAK